MTSPDWLHYQAEVNPNGLALSFEQHRWSFKELDDWVARLAGQLRFMGIASGDRVAWLLPPSAFTVALAHALLRVHATLVPLNTRLTTPELTAILHDADPKLVVADPRWSTRLACRDQHEFIPQGSFEQLWRAANGAAIGDATFDWDDLHSLVYTSGTTGRPKGVEITLGNQWWSAMAFGLNAGTNADDRWLHVMPLFHVGGLSILFRSVIHGSAIILGARFDPDFVIKQLREARITLMSLVPTMLRRLLDQPSDIPKEVRLILLGGAPAPLDLVQEALARGLPVVQTYGLTETCSQIATMTRDAFTLYPGASGHATLPTQIKITRDGQDVGPGHEGEICVKGPTVARGYWQHPEATDEAFQDGWFKTGDIGRLNPEGYVTVLDRRRDLIIHGGENVYPSEVEALLMRVPGVQDAVVVGIDDREWGQKVVAGVVVEDVIPEKLLRRMIETHLASYKHPAVYCSLEKVPRTASGKILRHEARAAIMSLEPEL